MVLKVIGTNDFAEEYYSITCCTETSAQYKYVSKQTSVTYNNQEMLLN